MKSKQKSNKRSKKKMYRNNKNRSRRVNIKSVKRTRKLKRKALVGGMLAGYGSSGIQPMVTKEEYENKIRALENKMESLVTKKKYENKIRALENKMESLELENLTHKVTLMSDIKRDRYYLAKKAVDNNQKVLNGAYTAEQMAADIRLAQETTKPPPSR